MLKLTVSSKFDGKQRWPGYHLDNSIDRVIKQRISVVNIIKQFTNVIYDSRVILTGKLPILLL